MQFFYVELVVVGYGDDGDFLNAVFFVERKFVLGFAPETLFIFKRSGDDEFVCLCDIAVNTQSTYINMVFNEREGYHGVELGTERLFGSEIFDKGKVIHDHLFAAAFNGIVYEVDQPLFFKTFHTFIDKIFGDPEMLFGKSVDLVNGQRLGVVTRGNEYEGLFIGNELLLKKLLHLQSGLFFVFCHDR